MFVCFLGKATKVRRKEETTAWEC